MKKLWISLAFSAVALLAVQAGTVQSPAPAELAEVIIVDPWISTPAVA